MKHWITLNEPWSYSNAGYAVGAFAPGRGSSSSTTVKDSNTLHRGCDIQQPSNNGNPGTEPYLVTHNQLLAHAAAVKLYKEKFQVSPCY